MDKYDIIQFEPWVSTLDSEILLTVSWLNNEIIHETEVLAYDFLTLVSNFGGSLGLFLGFSFFMFYDTVAMIFNILKRKS